MIKNNNPGNIRYNANNNWVGQIGKDYRGFVIFDNLNNGTRAVFRLITNYIQNGHNTIEKILYRYAPPQDNNNTERYILNVSGWMGPGYNRNSKIDPANAAQLKKFVHSIVKQETGESIALNYLDYGYNNGVKPGVILPDADNNTFFASFNPVTGLILAGLLITLLKTQNNN